MSEFEIDAEVQHFIDTYLSVSDNLSTGTSIEEQRRGYEKICQYFSYPEPDAVEFYDSQFEGRHGPIKLRHYHNRQSERNDIRLLFAHGGGFILGSLDSHHDICCELCDQTGFDILSVDYRLSPEFHHPVHLDDFEDAYFEAFNGKTILVGVSAGAALAAGLSYRLKTSHSVLPVGQILIYPGLGGDQLKLDSYFDNAQAPLLTTDDVVFYRKVRCVDGQIPVDDPEFYPLVAESFSGLPATIALSADIDPLRDDSAKYVEKTNAAGASNEWINLAGLPHDFLRARHISKKAAAGFEEIVQAIKRIAKGCEK